MTHFNVTPRALARSAVAFAAAALLSGASMAATLLADDFQGDLSQWQAGGSAVIVADPLVSGGKALAFNAGAGGGDLFSSQSYTSSTGHFTLSYDYLGIAAGGGYVGIDVSNGNSTWEVWLSGDGSYSTSNTNPNTGNWEHVSFSFQSAFPITLKLEEWYGQNGTPQQALFKNLVLSEAGSVATVPEPGAYAMVLGGLAVLALSRRRAVKRNA